MAVEPNVHATQDVSSTTIATGSDFAYGLHLSSTTHNGTITADPLFLSDSDNYVGDHTSNEQTYLDPQTSPDNQEVVSESPWAMTTQTQHTTGTINISNATGPSSSALAPATQAVSGAGGGMGLDGTSTFTLMASPPRRYIRRGENYYLNIYAPTFKPSTFNI
ncbi:hypothetical protein P691DRAFT_810702 [Macrolepiota fuliginosa MF-IS2]|uniref:Uncharacterized protein n=1 Tax=Macrolepiota fuliginosa MF-IS2 TaxID=1400762 RepID=A0A9P5XFX5_9AGAR|nr:hypothetical protein P691DRAFT_810702 [Macrolepiota fuliginosa MF-IS2]